jgi:RNA polymerase sigma-70 factor (ECF subfamily)
MNEKELIRKAKKGDFKAFSSLINANKGKIYALVFRLVGNREDAEDVFQETFLKVIDNIEKFRGDSAFSTWLHSIAINQVRALYGKRQQADLQPIEDYLLDADDFKPHSVFLNWKNPDLLLENKELQNQINEALDKLPLVYREAFLLRYISELSVKEIAQLLNETEASTKSRIFRARLALRDELATAIKDLYGT